MKGNINTKEYWELRFQKNWKKNGATQTTEYAKANVKHIPLTANFRGTLLDFGCASGDAIPVYAEAFPEAKLSGVDISETAIDACKKKYGTIADFFTGGINDLGNFDTIVASHVMEHITDDKIIVKELLKKCKDLFVFVPFKESPLFIEHVNYYERDYYNDMYPADIKVFKVQYLKPIPLKTVIKNLFKLRYIPSYPFSKDIIMFHLKGFNETILS
jgi:hypothetical protein